MNSKLSARVDAGLGRLIRHGISVFFFVVVAGGALAAFVHFELLLQAGTLNLAAYWPQSLIPLAVLVAFSGLMYNRARAVGTTALKHRFRSMYAAERLLAASCFYLAGLVTTLFVGLTSDFFVSLFKVTNEGVWEFKMGMYGLAVPLFGWAIMEVSHAIRFIAPNGAYRRTISVARRVRKML